MLKRFLKILHSYLNDHKLSNSSQGERPYPTVQHTHPHVLITAEQYGGGHGLRVNDHIQFAIK